MVRTFRALIISLIVAVYSGLAPFPASASDPLRQAELSIMGLDHEVVAVFRYGRQIARYTGNGYAAVVPVDWRLRDAIITHNHTVWGLPSLSPNDLNTCAKGLCAEVRAVSLRYGYPTVCHAWRLPGRGWRRFDVRGMYTWIETQTNGRYGSWQEQDAAIRGYLIGLSYQMGFGYECVPWGLS